MKFHLKDLINYRDIVVQCHDNPDADALASGYALVWYLKKQDIDARFVYGGKEAVQKSNLLKMIDDLQITVEHITELPEPELLVTVDCQYGESNVTKFDANKVIVIDHHRVSGELPDPSDVRSNYGSCSTVLYELLTAEGLDINENKRLATALYYGLMTDTDNFSSLFHPADRDLPGCKQPLSAAHAGHVQAHREGTPSDDGRKKGTLPGLLPLLRVSAAGAGLPGGDGWQRRRRHCFAGRNGA